MLLFMGDISVYIQRFNLNLPVKFHVAFTESVQ